MVATETFRNLFKDADDLPPWGHPHLQLQNVQILGPAME